MYDWREFDPKKPPQVGKTYLVYVPGNETGEYITTEFYNYDGETCFWCVLTGSEVLGITHYSEVGIDVSSIKKNSDLLEDNIRLKKEIDNLRTPRPIEDWHEDYGDVLWWEFSISEPPYCGTPLDSDWPDCHTHWTPIAVPENVG